MTNCKHTFSAILLLTWCIGATGCSDCLGQKPASPSLNHTKQTEMTSKIKAIATGYVKSGTYGGSTQSEVFPTVYHYSYFDGEQSALREEFQSLLTQYLVHVTVNNSVRLDEYLTYLYQHDIEKLKEIHAQKKQELKAMGNSHQDLDKLFFVDDEAGTVLRVDPYLTDLSWNEQSNKLILFLQKNARHFSSQVPDDFFTEYYGK